MGTLRILDRILMLDYRLFLVALTASALYFQPRLVRAVAPTAELAPGSRVNYSFSIRRDKAGNGLRLVQTVLIALLAWLAMGLLPLLLQSLHWPLIHDAPIMHYVAWRILHGEVPYRDIFDMNLPGVYLIHIIVLKVFGASDAGWRLFDLLWLVLTNCLLWALCCSRGKGWAIASVLLYSAFHLSSGAPGMGQRDYFEFTFLAGGLVLAIRALESGPDRRRLFLSGLALGYAVSIKPLAILLLAAVAILAATRSGCTRSEQAKSVGATLAGGLVAPALFTVWLAAIGGLKPFLVTFAGVMPLYSKMHDRPFLQYLAEYWPIWLPCILAIPVTMLYGRPDSRRLLLVMGVAYGALHYAAQGKGWLYQLYPLVGFGGALMAANLEMLSRTTRRRTIVAATALTVFFTLAIGCWDSRLQPANALTVDTLDTVASLERDMRPQLAPGVTVQSFDTTAGCSHALMRMNAPMPTPYLCDYLFYGDPAEPYVRTIQDRFMADMRARPPTFLVVYRWGWPSGQYERLARFPALQQWIRDSYRLELTRQKYVIYKQKDAAPPDSVQISR